MSKLTNLQVFQSDDPQKKFALQILRRIAKRFRYKCGYSTRNLKKKGFDKKKVFIRAVTWEEAAQIVIKEMGLLDDTGNHVFDKE